MRGLKGTSQQPPFIPSLWGRGCRAHHPQDTPSTKETCMSQGYLLNKIKTVKPEKQAKSGEGVKTEKRPMNSITVRKEPSFLTFTSFVPANTFQIINTRLGKRN